MQTEWLFMPFPYLTIFLWNLYAICIWRIFPNFSGDRIISVNGESVSGKSYAEVVSLIQRLRDNLSLIVVPQQDDILQMVKKN